MRGGATRGDIAAMAAVLLLAAGIFLSGLHRAGEGQLTAVIRQDGQVVRRIVLTGLEEAVTVTVTGRYENVIVAENGAVRVQSATCPNQTCVHTGTLTRAGQSAVCLENRMTLTVEGQADVDVVVR